MPYNHTAIEKKWQKYWAENRTFRALDPDEAGDWPKKYILDMFPYPSGDGLHAGHVVQQTATDILSRYYRMNGFNVLHPMGWDAFGLPAEQYAVRNNVHPAKTTRRNIDNFRKQIQSLGMSYDWDREVNTTDPDYYRWTQWIFLQLYNSYFDPFDQQAKPISHLVNELINDNLLVAPDGSVHINPVQEGMEAISGDFTLLRRWSTYTPVEQRDLLDGLRLAYTDEVPVNWCPGLGTVLANEEVIDGKSEVGGFPVERRPLRQWMLRITAYADRLLADLDELSWPESLKEMQRNWIGRSIGAEVDFEILREAPAAATGMGNATPMVAATASSSTAVTAGVSPAPSAADAPAPGPIVTVFTTRPDTLFGATYMVLAPEHALVDHITTNEQRVAVEQYRMGARSKSDRERQLDAKDKTGVFTGAYAINPVNDELTPVWIADYVLMGYGTGAIMAVPAHDERDFQFAKKFDLPIRPVVEPAPRPDDYDPNVRAFTGAGLVINSEFLNGLTTPEAKTRMIEFLELENAGRGKINYKLRDWLFSRQRYWGEPFPIVLDPAGNHFAVVDEELPVTLPEMEDFKPTGTPEPPLTKAVEWLRYSDALTRETNTMPQWAGSCWYYLRYLDPKNSAAFVSPEKERYWMPVDLYVGGVEHAVLHLLYARFWHKVLYDLGFVSTVEPFARLVNQGLILGETEFHFFETPGGAISASEFGNITEEATADGPQLVGTHSTTGEKMTATRVIEQLVEKKGQNYVLKARPEVTVDARSFKMSKSRGNVVNPTELVTEYGADAFRMYEMYMGPLEAQKPWSTRDITGLSRLLAGVWRNIAGDNDAGGVTTADDVADDGDGAESPGAFTGSKVSTPPSSAGRLSDEAIPEEVDRQLHAAIKKITEDIEALRFNTAIAELFKLHNTMNALATIPHALADKFVLLLCPFAPHICEELWQRLGHDHTVGHAQWPTFDPDKLVATTMELPVQVNGKLRDKITVAADATEDDIFQAVEGSEKVQAWLTGTIVKRLYVPSKLVNYVVQ